MSVEAVQELQGRRSMITQSVPSKAHMHEHITPVKGLACS